MAHKDSSNPKSISMGSLSLSCNTSTNSDVDTSIDKFVQKGYKSNDIRQCMIAAYDDPILAEQYLINVCYLNNYTI